MYLTTIHLLGFERLSSAKKIVRPLKHHGILKHLLSSIFSYSVFLHPLHLFFLQTIYSLPNFNSSPPKKIDGWKTTGFLGETGLQVVSSLFGELKSCITLAAMRCVLRTLTAAPCEDKNFVEVMSQANGWRMLEDWEERKTNDAN